MTNLHRLILIGFFSKIPPLFFLKFPDRIVHFVNIQRSLPTFNQLTYVARRPSYSFCECSLVTRYGIDDDDEVNSSVTVAVAFTVVTLFSDSGI